MRSFAVLCLVTQLCPTLCNPMNCSPPGSSVHGDSPGKNTGVGCHALLQGIFLTHGSDPGLLALHLKFSPTEPPGKPKDTGVVSLSLLQGNFPTQESNEGLLHCRQIHYQRLPGKPMSFHLFCFAVYLDLSHNQNQNLCFSLWTHIMCVLFCCSLVELRHCLPHL